MSKTGSEWTTRPNHQVIPFVDSRIYTDQQIFEEEIDKIWRKVWLLTSTSRRSRNTRL